MDEFIAIHDRIHLLTISLVIGAWVTDRGTKGHREERVPRPAQVINMYLKGNPGSLTVANGCPAQ